MQVIGVKFRTSPRVYWFAPTDEEFNKGDRVVVETQRGMELATVEEAPHDVEESKITQPLKSILRKATAADIEAEEADNAGKREILATAKEKVAARNLDMKIVDCEFTVDHSKLVLYFTAEQRVDFRDLVRDLASAFHIRIDLRQIGSREECKLIGSLGACGLPCCCCRFESDAEHVSIKMAKNQSLALTPTKINGVCGRLMCCLAYENKTYEDFIKRCPKHGARVTAPDGRQGTVVSATALTEKVRVRFGDDENFEFGEFQLSELCVGDAPRDNAVDPKAKSNKRNDRPEKPRSDRNDTADRSEKKNEKRADAPTDDREQKPANKNNRHRRHGKPDRRKGNGDGKREE